MSSLTSAATFVSVASQNCSNSSYETRLRLRLPTFTEWISPALILREIVDRETPIASATGSGVSIRCFDVSVTMWRPLRPPAERRRYPAPARQGARQNPHAPAYVLGIDREVRQ